MKTIQQILDEERIKSGITEKTNHEVAMDVINRTKVLDPSIHNKKRETMLAKYQDPEYRKYKAQILQEVTQTKQWRQAHSKGMDKRVENGWAEKNLKAREKTFKPVRTPYGDFPSKKAAVAGMTAQGVVNAGGKLTVWLKTKPTEYYYIKDKQ